jgi:predicted AlkP superfamily pyrophosphatase or phosphodiesterase
MRARHRILVSLVVAASLLAPSFAKPASRPRLAVVIVVDGLSYDRLERLRPWLTSGLKRLLDDGAVATECRYAHLNTETAPGHASIATGAPPRVHGIPLNQWFVPSKDGTSMIPVYSASQDSPDAILGPGHLRVPTLGDRLVANDPRSRVVSIAGKDRAAILMAGRDRRHAVAWWSTRDASFKTSPAYDPSSPAGSALARILAAFDAERSGGKLAARYGAVWSRLPLPTVPPPDGFVPGLEDHRDHKFGPAFPHDLSAATLPYGSALMWSPIGDRLLADLAIRLIDDDALALGRRGVPDLLMLSFSANDYVSHYDGPDAIEDLEVLRALDLDIGRILDDLSRRFPAGLQVALTADHGFLPLPEAVHRLPLDRFAGDLNTRLEDALCLPPDADPVSKLECWSLFLDVAKRVLRTREGRCGPGGRAVTRDDVLAALPAAVREASGGSVERVIPLAPDCKIGGDDPAAAQERNACVPGRSGDAFLIPRRGTVLDWDAGRGTAHGSQFDYDTHVPLVVWGSGVARGRIEVAVTPYDLAPTLAAWLGVAMPDATGTRIDLGVPETSVSR